MSKLEDSGFAPIVGDFLVVKRDKQGNILKHEDILTSKSIKKENKSIRLKKEIKQLRKDIKNIQSNIKKLESILNKKCNKELKLIEKLGYNLK